MQAQASAAATGTAATETPASTEVPTYLSRRKARLLPPVHQPVILGVKTCWIFLSPPVCLFAWLRRRPFNTTRTFESVTEGFLVGRITGGYSIPVHFKKGMFYSHT